MNQEGFTVWFTGLSGSGKTTLAELLRDQLIGRGLRVEWLDSAKIRRELNRDLGFTRRDIEANLRRIGYECKLLNRNGVVGIVSAISPYRDVRDVIRTEVGRFVEVYCRCPIEVLMSRDDHDLFERARRGEIENVAGVNAPYEEPFKPEVLLNTDVETSDACVRKILTTLEILGYLPRAESAAYSREEEDLIKSRLRDLGYI